MFLVLQQDKLWKISFAFCLLQELPMRCSAINLVDSGDSPWGRLHGHIQIICTFDSSHSRADTKWRLSVSYLTLSCLQNVKGLSLNPELHQIASVPQKTHRQALILFIESYIGSFEVTINSDFIRICLYDSWVLLMLKLNENEKLKLIFSHFQFINLQIIRTWPQIHMG